MFRNQPFQVKLGSVLCALILWTSSQAFAQTTHTVELIGLSFVPQDLQIEVGDTVEWEWVSGVHNVDSDDGYFSSGAPVPPPSSFSVTFDAAFLASNPPIACNTYGYHCDPHLALGMVGTIKVGGPTLSVANLTAGQNVTITVTDATPNGIVGVAYSLAGGGPTSVPVPGCGVMSLALSPPIVQLPASSANGSGTWTFTGPVPPGTTGVNVWMQAVDLACCLASNGLAETIN